MQHSSWAERLELVGDDDRLVGSAGALPLRLLAERTGLRAGLSTAMAPLGVTSAGQVAAILERYGPTKPYGLPPPNALPPPP